MQLFEKACLKMTNNKELEVKGYIKNVHPGVKCVTISNCVKRESGTNV